jgi:hypothetical protein
VCVFYRERERFCVLGFLSYGSLCVSLCLLCVFSVLMTEVFSYGFLVSEVSVCLCVCRLSLCLKVCGCLESL